METLYEVSRFLDLAVIDGHTFFGRLERASGHRESDWLRIFQNWTSIRVERYNFVVWLPFDSRGVETSDSTWHAFTAPIETLCTARRLKTITAECVSWYCLRRTSTYRTERGTRRCTTFFFSLQVIVK